VRLSGSFDLVSVASRHAVCAPPDRSGEIVCEVGEVPPGGVFGVVSVTVTPTAAGEITISASVSAREPDPAPANNAASASVNVRPARPVGEIDLSPRFEPLSQAFVGLPAGVMLSVANSRSGDATGVRLRVTVSGAFSDLAGTLAPSGLPLDCSREGMATLVCEQMRGSATGEEGSALVTFVPTEPGLITIDAAVSANEPDLNPANDAASFVMAVRPSKVADLAVELAGSSDPARVGDALTYEVAVVNNGPDAASDVHFDLAAGDMRLVSIESSQGNCDLPLPPSVLPISSVSCALGTLGAGESVPIRIQALPTESGTFVVNAFVQNRRFGEVDREPGNDSAVVTTEVTGPNRATTWGAGSILPVSLMAFVPCSGDLVVLEGSLHASFHLTIDAAGTVHLHTHVNARALVGFALGSGARYRSTGTWSSQETFSPPLARSFTFVTNQRLIGTGAAADATVHQNVHVTLSADGEIRTSVDNFRFECR
jgi:hypothetical protein